MGRICTICRHPERAELDRLLVEGTPFRKLVKRFGTSLAALSRHRGDHIPEAIVKAQEAKEVDHGRDLFIQMIDLSERTLRILAQAEASNDFRLALTAIREARGNLELQCKVIASQMSQESREGSASYINSGYQSGSADSPHGEPDLSVLSDEEFAQIVRLMEVAEERSRRRYQRPGLEGMVNFTAG